ncbi:MAG: glycoside hydrolase family 15 protein, partial [Gemmatimonadales bacterium]
MPYQPIEDYGIIGDLRTVALVGRNGSIDWFCYPNFDSPSVFAAILDEKKGGQFQIAPHPDHATHKQMYWPDTNVLITRFLSPDGVAEVCDFMPVNHGTGAHGQLVRRVTLVRGQLPLRMTCFPAFNYGRDKHRVEVQSHSACFLSSSLDLGLTSNVPLRAEGAGVTADIELQEGQSAVFVLRPLRDGQCERGLSVEEAEEHFRRTVEYWRRWLSQCTYRGRWREMVHRSALALKLLTYEPTGAIVAAPTCSLPEGIGGERNWDYRYTWIRDAAFTIYAFLRLGFTQEAARFMEWLEARAHEVPPDGTLQIMYGVDGR